MPKPRLTIAEFAAAVGMSQMSAMNALRADSRLPKSERQYPFATATPPAERGGKWRYDIPRGPFEAWQAGQGAHGLDIKALARELAPLLAPELMACFAKALNQK